MVTILNAAGETLATVSITVPQPDAANDITGQDFNLTVVPQPTATANMNIQVRTLGTTQILRVTVNSVTNLTGATQFT
jgi:hypothetical protein